MYYNNSNYVDNYDDGEDRAEKKKIIVCYTKKLFSISTGWFRSISSEN